MRLFTRYAGTHIFAKKYSLVKEWLVRKRNIDNLIFFSLLVRKKKINIAKQESEEERVHSIILCKHVNATRK